MFRRVVSGRPGTLTHVAQEPARGGFDEVEYFLETVGSTVIGVGHFLGVAVWREFQKQPQALTGLLRHSPLQHREILAIHGENEVEALEIARLDDTRAQRLEVITAPRGGRPHARVGGLADVIARGAGGIHFESELGRFARRQRAHHRFSRRRSTDISQADKQDTHTGLLQPFRDIAYPYPGV